MWTNEKSTVLTSILTKAIIVFMVIGLFALPFGAKWYDSVSEKPSVFVHLLVTLYTAYIPGFIMMFSLDKLLSNIRKKEVFTEQNIKYLRISSWCCFIASICFFVFGFWRPLSFLLSFAAIFLGLVIRVIKNTFSQALILREENEFTI